MTKLEELKAAYLAADADAWDAHVAEWRAYITELKKIQEENSND
jgi:hypothetical protein